MRLLEREEPLSVLTGLVRSAAGGRGGVALVTGEPGIGKTALVGALAARSGGARVLLGACDDLSTPRPLGPLVDVARAAGGRLAGALTGTPGEVHDALLAELAGPGPTVLVLEDVHWADDATVDAVRTVGRRIPSLPALLVLTYRDGEVDGAARLRSALAALPPSAVTRLPLAPLSRAAVAALAGDDAGRVHALTGGNPFYVTELAGAAGLPGSVRDAVGARLAALAPPARELAELAAVVPGRVPAAVLDAALPGWAEAADEAERRGLLEVGATEVRFRHELARRAVEEGLSGAARRRLHARVLRALEAVGADPAELVHHAERAGDAAAAAAAALPAARRAAAASANREAHAQYRRAVRGAGRLPAAERARLNEEYATAAYLVGRIPEALAAVDEAAVGYAAGGDTLALGRCVRTRSRLHWYAGDGAAAEREARSAVALLEPLGESAELARACSVVSQLAMLGGRTEETLAWGTRAAAMARRAGDRSTYAHALVNTGMVRATRDPDDTAALEEAAAVADGSGDPHEAVRALVCAAWSQLMWVRPAQARALALRAHAYAARHEVEGLREYLEVTLAWLRLREGEWSTAEAVAREQLDRGVTVTQLLAKTVLAEIAVRRGDDDAGARLADVAAQAGATREMQRIEPVLELEVEYALTRSLPMPVDRVREVEAIARATDWADWGGVRMAAWAAVAGCPVPVRGRVAAPHAAVLAGDWAAAAAAFGAVGWDYDRALALSFLGDAASLGEALETARALGATPLAALVTRRMRERGIAVRHGRRASTRAHPAGLTDRQAQVLRLLADGLTNAEIAERLVVSPRTAEHHVTAVLGRLGVAGRREAVRRAGELGLLSS